MNEIHFGNFFFRNNIFLKKKHWVGINELITQKLMASYKKLNILSGKIIVLHFNSL